MGFSPASNLSICIGALAGFAFCDGLFIQSVTTSAEMFEHISFLFLFFFFFNKCKMGEIMKNYNQISQTFTNILQKLVLVDMWNVHLTWRRCLCYDKIFDSYLFLRLQDPNPVQFAAVHSSTPNAEVLFISR